MSSKLLAALMFLTVLAVSPFSRAATLHDHNDIAIDYDGDFDAAHGVISGDGTQAHPYLIAGWKIGELSIRDTTKAVMIKDNTITGKLRLNWMGDTITVVDNTINDLRVNENIARWGDPTMADIEHNTITVVGQLRHFDGMFAHNTVGTPMGTSLARAGIKKYPDTEAVNFDGFNGAHFEHNTIYGFVVARLHGHHHSSGFGRPSHMHNDGPHSMEMVDHSRRYHEVTIAENSIYSSAAFALEYTDTNHAANDRTANSETNPYLNAPHTHYTRIHILGNTLVGSGLLVNVFNAQDVKHIRAPWGVLDIAGNTVQADRNATNPLAAVNGIEVLQARYMRLNISRNSVSGPTPLTGVFALDSHVENGAGVLLDQLDHSVVTVRSTHVTNISTGVQATQLSKSVSWQVHDLITENVNTPVAYDSSVAQAPSH